MEARQLQKRVLQEGKGDTPCPGDTVVIAYTGYLKDDTKPDQKGKQFDGQPTFTTPIGVGRLIQGWEEGVIKMKVGEEAVLDIPSHMGYKERGFGNIIPPNSDLIFDVHLKEIKKKN
ncbi:FK506-binding protein 1B [Ceratocystis fimbriata CBS 114723]|uniref:peptidylprolyl isomerase n=1 Tax=Ceratocystis fimbriata CBS 114723 TaxID=1035309 RepID=A0A2C5XH69_9PEZI|nr:FK506-binding protein 1B [Ceratocystis fimbriata CBS 114723]